MNILRQPAGRFKLFQSLSFTPHLHSRWCAEDMVFLAVSGWGARRAGPNVWLREIHACTLFMSFDPDSRGNLFGLNIPFVISGHA